MGGKLVRSIQEIMRWSTSDVSGDIEGLSQFTKNRHFKGKLMTPRIMQSAREYQSERLQTLNRFVDGTGLVYGLGVSSINETQTGIEVTIEPGLALDGRGQPIVVEQVTTKSLPDVSSEELHLFIQFDEVAIETVPVPETDGAIEEEAVPNRMVETFELTHRESPPETAPTVPQLDFSDVDLETADPTLLMQELAEQYHEKQRTGPRDEGNPAVYLGGFERTHDGAWVAKTDAPTREHVYDHQMLCTLLAQHIADTENPHQTPVHEPIDPQPDDLDALSDRLDTVEETIDELERERDTFVQYTLRKTIKDRSRFFAGLSDRIEKQSGDASRLARETARMSTDEFIPGDRMESEYRQQISTILDHLIEVGDALEGVVTEESLEEYLIAVSELQSAVEGETDLLGLIEADNRVCETADSLDVLVDVVPDV